MTLNSNVFFFLNETTSLTMSLKTEKLNNNLILHKRKHNNVDKKRQNKTMSNRTTKKERTIKHFTSIIILYIY